MTSYLRNKKSPPIQTERVEVKQKGNRPNTSIALTSDELNMLYKKGLISTRNPEALLNTLWLNCTLHFGLRGCKEHRDMCRGDVKLKETAGGKEYLGFNERQTKTRIDTDCRDIRAIVPKMFATDESEKDPIVVYKLYAQKRPEK